MSSVGSPKGWSIDERVATSTEPPSTPTVRWNTIVSSSFISDGASSNAELFTGPASATGWPNGFVGSQREGVRRLAADVRYLLEIVEPDDRVARQGGGQDDHHDPPDGAHASIVARTRPAARLIVAVLASYLLQSA